jgi:ankyrin repeat protein
MDLCAAAKMGVAQKVQELLDNGADVNDQDEIYRRTALSWAAEKRRDR